jgi:hypothetical protein
MCLRKRQPEGKLQKQQKLRALYVSKTQRDSIESI